MNETKSKIMKIRKNGEEYGVNISLNDKKLKHIDISEWIC